MTRYFVHAVLIFSLQQKTIKSRVSINKSYLYFNPFFFYLDKQHEFVVRKCSYISECPFQSSCTCNTRTIPLHLYTTPLHEIYYSFFFLKMLTDRIESFVDAICKLKDTELYDSNYIKLIY